MWLNVQTLPFHNHSPHWKCLNDHGNAFGSYFEFQWFFSWILWIICLYNWHFNHVSLKRWKKAAGNKGQYLVYQIEFPDEHKRDLWWVINLQGTWIFVSIINLDIIFGIGLAPINLKTQDVDLPKCCLGPSGTSLTCCQIGTPSQRSANAWYNIMTN